MRSLMPGVWLCSYGGRIDVELDEADIRIVGVRLRPVGVDEGVSVARAARPDICHGD